MSKPLVTINLVVLNGEKYVRHCLDAILAQTYPQELIEFNVLDNGSTDSTIAIIEGSILDIRNSKLQINFIKNKINLGMWPGQEELLNHSSGKYILAMAVDVILDKDFIKNAVEEMERDNKVGALQAKIYRYDIQKLETRKVPLRTSGHLYGIGNWKLEIGGTIDTVGFKIFRSRRLINIGHGQEDNGQFNNRMEIFGVEGAAPFFRREALESCRIPVTSYKLQVTGSEIFDHDYVWYGDDFDFAWRMNLFGWKQIFEPSVVAWHDRQTTKKLRKNFSDFLKIRRSIPLRKRQLEWKNIRFTIVKNDYTINILKDLPQIAVREVAMFGYLLIFEPAVLLEVGNFLKLLPKMIKKRKEIMRRAKISSQEIHKYFK